MNKKTIAILGTAVLVLSLASVSLAGPMGGGMGMGGGRGMGGGMGMGPQGQPPAQLTEQQLGALQTADPGFVRLLIRLLEDGFVAGDERRAIKRLQAVQAMA